MGLRHRSPCCLPRCPFFVTTFQHFVPISKATVETNYYIKLHFNPSVLKHTVETMYFQELNNDQRREMINSQQRFEALRDAKIVRSAWVAFP